MTALLKFISTRRVLAICTFAVVYPVFTALVTDALMGIFPHFRAFFDQVADRSAVVSDVLGIAIHFLPVLVAFWFLPITPRKRFVISVVTITLIYLIVMIPLTVVFSYKVHCFVNPKCVRL